MTDAQDSFADLDALIDAVNAIVDDEGTRPTEAASRVLADTTPLPDTDDVLRVRGLAAFAADIRGRFNRLTEPETQRQKDKVATFLGRFQLRTKHDAGADVMERVTLSGKDHMKPLIDFTLADVKAFRSQSVAKAGAWQLRVNVMKEYEKMLVDHKATTGRDLPAKALQAIRIKAEAAWS